MNQSRVEYILFTESIKDVLKYIGYCFAEFAEIMKRIIRYVTYRFARFLVHQPKIALYSGVSIVVIAIVCIFAVQSGPVLSAHADHENTKYFTTVQIEAGDTLWDISQEYISPEYASIQDYIDEVESINHISVDDITAGCYITIPYYSEEPINQ